MVVFVDFDSCLAGGMCGALFFDLIGKILLLLPHFPMSMIVRLWFPFFFFIFLFLFGFREIDVGV